MIVSTSKRSSLGHMPCLDGLRGLASLVVLFGHARDFGLPTFVDRGARDCGVLIFFALSGFLMGSLYLSKPPTVENIRNYAAARIGRILPIYFIVVLASFLLAHFISHFVYSINLIQLLRLFTFNGSASVFWSIGPEVQFYVVFVALWMLSHRVGRFWFVLIVLALSAVCLTTIRVWPGIFVASKFHIFALGALAAILRERISGRMSAILVILGHSVAAAILVTFLFPGFDRAVFGLAAHDVSFSAFYGSIPRVFAASVVVFSLSFVSRPALLVFANPVMVGLGRWSFSLYLLHLAVFDLALRTGLFTGLPGWMITLALACLSIAIAWLSYRTVEDPLHRYTRSLLRYHAEQGTRPQPEFSTFGPR